MSWLSFLLLRFAPIGVLILAALATVGAPLMQFWARLDAMTHFRIYWIFILLGLAIYFFARRRLIVGSAAAGTMLFCVASIASYEFGQVSSREDGIRVAAYNIRASKRAGTDVIDYFTNPAKPDVLLMTEITFDWLKRLGPLREHWPHEVVEPRKNSNGIWLLSRFPIRDVDQSGIAEEERCPFISAIVETPNGDIRVIGVHPSIPISSRGSRAQEVQFRQFEEIAARSQIPVVMLGDFNCTPFSSRFKRLLKNAKLKEAAVGFGLRNTWRRDVSTLPIDHVLVSMDVAVSHHEVGPRLKSDHNAIVADIHLPLNQIDN